MSVWLAKGVAMASMTAASYTPYQDLNYQYPYNGNLGAFSDTKTP